MTALVALPATEAVADACSPPVNVIACENAQPGAPVTEWDVVGAGDPGIQGFTTDISVNVGQQIGFKIKTTASSYTINIYRLGFYNGDGARRIAIVTPSVSLPQNQPACVTDPATEIYDCGTWAVSATWTVPSTAVSGVYIARLQRPGAQDGSHIPFVVRDDSSHSAVFFQTSDTTWQAYNTYGGSNFYQGAANGRAYKLSYNRPFATRGNDAGRDYLFSNEYPMLRFLERNGYDITYTTGVDSDRRGDLIRNHRIFVSTGHDEYWSGQQRTNVESARDAGVNLAFFSGNEVYWRTRWENSQDGSGTAYRTLVCYKETWANARIDPTPEWTGTWRDPRFSPPAVGGNRTENGLTGTAYMANHDDLNLQVPADQGRFRLWRNTDVATLADGQVATLAPHIVGYESDEDLDNGFRPAGLIRLSTTTGSTPQYLRDFGNTVSPGTTTHHLTLYKAPSGALVFSAGTIQWAWGLDQDHDGIQSPADNRMQQAMINLFADMGAQPGSLMTGLVAATASADTAAPTATITSPASGATLTNGAQITLQGTAADSGGGRVAGIEVSTDGGTSWHAATGTTSWSYAFFATGVSTQDVLVRATDDSANIGATTSRQFNLTGAHSIFGDRVPVTPSTADLAAIELGVRFTTQTSGFVTGIRFYKGTGNTGTHTGSLWNSSGARLATGTFSGETGSGWQILTFTNPVAVTANTRYIASYYAPNGHYAADAWAFSAADFVASPLTAVRSTASAGNGLFKYGGGFPNETYQDSNYFVDVLFSPTDDTSPVVVATRPLPDETDVLVTVHPSATFNKSLDPSTIQFTLRKGTATVAGTTAYDDATKTVTFTPSASLDPISTYTATVQASDTQGHAMSAPASWSFTTEQDPSISKLFANNALPSNTSVNDSNAVELGVRFVPSVNGTIVGVRYYQGAGNTGTHIGNLWTAGGTLLARVTFPAGSSTGWQYATFSSPVAVTAGTTYVASYFAPNGHYAANANFFASTWTNGPLSAPATSNGVYKYGSTTRFPNETYQATNYWVDALFMAGGTVPPPSTVSLFLAEDAPASPNWPDTAAIEVGVKFSSDVAGSVTTARFYKGAQNIGTHVGSLWTSDGTLLATATFQNETSSGWQAVTFAQPVNITAGSTYIVSYRTTVGYYSVNINAFSGTGFDRAPLHVPASGGVYRYGGGFPSGSSPHNYWVDIVFNPS